jgi:hypothetical protein
VLELGCAWGATTAHLALVAADVLGTDISPTCVKRARQDHPALRFAVLDAFDVRAAFELAPDTTAIFMDLSGLSSYRALLDVIALTTMYATVFRPRVIVVKSGALKQFASHCHAWPDRFIARPAADGTAMMQQEDAHV